MKAVRYVLIALAALILLAVAAVAVAIAVINPNDYKPQIEQAAEKATNLDLILEGDIDWSFIPLGLELNVVQATLEGNRFVALERLIARVDFWSLIAMSPKVNTFVLDGLDARLEVNEQGSGNWTRILPEKAAGAETTTATSAQAEQAQEYDNAGAAPLNFSIENVQISNSRLHYTDKSTGQSVTLENVTVNASGITLGSEFPLDIAFQVATAQPILAVDGSISGRLTANEALNEFSVSGLRAMFDMSGEPFGGKEVTAELGGSARANLENQTASLSDFTASLANLSLATDLNVSGFGDKPTLSGKVSVAEFSLKELLNNLGQPAPETSDSTALEAIAFATGVGGPAGKVELTDLNITLDDTTFTGSGSYSLAEAGIVFQLQGDRLNADRYLPPQAKNDNKETSAPGPEAKSAAASAPPGTAAHTEEDLLPLATVRSLLLDLGLGLDQLIVSNLTINDVTARATAKNGLLNLDELSGKLYEGSFNANATLDARSNNPQWRIGSDVTNVQILPLLTDLADVDMLAGGANLSINASTSGNRISALRNNADGQISFNLAEGQFRQMNLTRMACQGIALANREELTTTDWGASTPFNDMRGTLDINGNVLNNTDLVAALAGMRLEGNGTVDMAKNQLDYELGLRVVGEIHRDNACRVTDYVENVVIPIECRGNVTDDPAGLCSFDGSRFRDTLKTIAENAARARAREEVDKAKTRAEDKVKEKIEEKIGDKLRDLFN